MEKDDVHTPAQIQLMQTQDLKYISMKRTIESNKIRRLQSELHLIDAANTVKNKHTFFVDSDENAKNFDVATHLQTHPMLLDRRTNRTRLNDLAKLTLPDVNQQVTIVWLYSICKLYFVEFFLDVGYSTEAT